MSSYSSKTFGVHFKKLRLQAGIWTLKELGNLLSEKGFIYEDSLFSHWQAGRKIPVRRDVLLAIAALFTKKNPDISLRDLNVFFESAQQGNLTNTEINTLNMTKKMSAEHRNRDWGDSPDVPVFFGRTKERDLLEQWILTESCRVVSIVGMKGIGKTRLSVKLGKGGIGKTDLSLTLAHGIESHFDYVIWRRLLNAPKVSDLLTDLITFFSHQQEVTLPNTVEEQISRLLHYLRKERCLIILDNVETILQGGIQAGYQPDYAAYGQLFEQIAQTSHQSCLLLTSREKTPEVARLENKSGPVRILELNGLEVAETKKIFGEIGTFIGSKEEWEHITLLYNGNPLAMELAARHVKEIFFGKLTDFLQEGKPLFADLRSLLDWHFNRLSAAHKEVMYWFAINREPTAISELKEDIFSFKGKESISSTLQSLQRLVPLERSSQCFTLQPVLIEYMTERLIEQVVEEIKTGEIHLFNSHAMLKASVPDYVRNIQTRLILEPVSEKLFEIYKSKTNVELRLKEILSLLREPHLTVGYAAGNVLNLLCHLQSEVKGYDFSNLSVWQAYLRGMTAQEINFTEANLSKSVFTDTFGSTLCVALSPKGGVLASGMATGEIRFWDMKTGLPLRTAHGHTDWIWSVTFSPDGETLVSCSGDHTVRLWDVKTGGLLHTFTGHTSTVYSVTFSSDGKTLASSGDDKTIILWDVKTGELLHIFTGHSNAIYSVAFSPNGELLASCSVDQTVRLWNIKNKEVMTTFQGHTQWIRAGIFSPDGGVFISAGGDKTIHIWEVPSGKLLTTLHGHTNWVWTVAVSPDGKLIASGSEDKTIRIWSTKTGQCLKTLQGHTSAVYSVAFSSDGEVLSSCGVDQTIRLWQVKTGKLLNTLQGYTNRAEIVVFSPDGKTLVSGHEDKSVRLWDVESGELRNTRTGHRHWVWTVAVSPDGKLVASGSEDKTIRIWERQSGRLLHILADHNHWVYSVAFSPDGKTLVSGGGDKTIRVWDIKTGKLLSLMSGHHHWVWSVAISPDGKQIASGSYDQTVRLWDIQTGKCLNIFRGHKYWISSVTFSPDGKLIVSGSGDKTIRLWDIQTGKGKHILKGHMNEVSSVAFSPDGKQIASGSYDQTVRLWDTKSGANLTTFPAHNHWVSSVTFSPDGRLIASGSYDGAIKLWDLQNGTCLRTLRSDRPYERMNITQVKGLTEAQKVALTLLGAIEETKP